MAALSDCHSRATRWSSAVFRLLVGLMLLGAFTFGVADGSGAPSYILNEGFEGPGFENTGWTKIGTPDEDYTATALDGLQSLHCLAGQQISRSFSTSNSFYFYCKARFISLPTFQGIMFWRNGFGNTMAELYFNNDFGNIELIHGSVIVRSTNLFVSGTTYDLWIEWTKGTGTDGTMKLFIATDSIKPQNPQVSIANGDGGAIERFILGPESPARGDVVFDLVLYSDSPIGDNPGGSQNHPPSISRVSNQTITEGTSTGPLAFTVNDVETAPGSLVVTGSSSNPTLVPNANIVLGGSGANRTINVTPAANQNGSATITLAVSDGQASTSTSFTVVVQPANGPTYLLSEDFEGPGFENPGWTKIGTPNEDYTAIALHGLESLNCLGGQRVYRTFSFADSFYLYFKVRFAVLPTFQSLIDWRDTFAGRVAQMYVNGGTVNLSHGTVFATSQTRFTTNVTYDVWIEWSKGTGSDGSFKLFVATDAIKPDSPEINITTGNGGAISRFDLGPESSGDVIFDRILVDDVPVGSMTGGSTNQPPTISNIADQTISTNSSTGPIPFTIGDAETPADSLLVSGSSSNPTLVPDANIVFGGSGTNRTVTVTPAGNQSGSATLTVTVSDGSQTARDSFILTVNGGSGRAVLTVTIDNATRIYGATNPVFTGSLTGVQNGDNITATYTSAATRADPVGNYQIVPVFNDPNGKLGNYTVVTNGGTLTVTTAPLSVNADDQARQYGVANPRLTGTISGLRNGDNITVLFTSPATASSAVGTYGITPVLSDWDKKLSNYTVSSHNGTLTIYPAGLIGRADDKIKHSGQPNPVFTVTYSGFVNGEDASIVTGTLVSSCPADAQSPPGTYPIKVSGQSAPNYTMEYQDGTLTVTGGEIVIQVDDATRAYGATNPIFRGTISGVQNGDNITATYTTAATAASPTGTYTITPVINDPDKKLGNYDLTVHNGTLTITPATLTGKADNKTRPYGQANPVFTVTYSGFVNGESAGIVTGTLVSSCPADARSPRGTYPITVSGQSAPNYTIDYKQGTLTVTGADLVIQIDNATRVYGAANPAFTGTVTGIQNGDNIAASYTTLATAASPAGTYPITAAFSDPGGKLSNYNLIAHNGTLTITPAPLNVTTDNKSRGFGTANPPLTGSIVGVKNGDNITVTYSTTANQLSLPGDYPITPALNDPGNKLGNYNVTLRYGTLTVTVVGPLTATLLKAAPTALIVSADNKTRPYGAGNPPLTGTVTGLLPGDNITATYSTIATAASPAGNYVISPVLHDPNGALGNYIVTVRPGTLTVKIGNVRITSIACVNNRAHISASGDANLTYTIQASTDLIHWKNVGTAISDASGHLNFIDGSASNMGTRFFRAFLP